MYRTERIKAHLTANGFSAFVRAKGFGRVVIRVDGAFVPPHELYDCLAAIGFRLKKVGCTFERTTGLMTTRLHAVAWKGQPVGSVSPTQQRAAYNHLEKWLRPPNHPPLSGLLVKIQRATGLVIPMDRARRCQRIVDQAMGRSLRLCFAQAHSVDEDLRHFGLMTLTTELREAGEEKG